MYSWNLKDLDRLYKTYSKKAEDEEELSAQIEYENTANNILDVISHYDSYLSDDASGKCSSKESKDSFADIITEDKTIIRTYGTYISVIRSFSDQLDLTKISLGKEKYKNIITSQSGIVTMSTEFYHQFKGVFSNAYDNLAANFRNRLMFRPSNPNERYGGNTFPIYGTREVFMDCIKANTLQDYISHIHESSHGINSIINPGIVWDEQKYCLIEVDSIFFELIGNEFVSSKLDYLKEGYNIKMRTFYDYLYSADLICSKTDMYNELSQNDLNNKRLVRAFYKKEIGYDRTLIKDAMYSSISGYMHYVISYLTAVELYLVYRVDKDKALDMLYRIMMLKNLDNAHYLDEVRKIGIEPGHNVKIYYEILKNEEDDLNNGKKLQYTI